MRHGDRHRKLNRTSSHRKALFRNLINALVKHETIRTTLPKAKELRPIVERLVTSSRCSPETMVASKRRAFSIVRDRETVTKLFSDLAVRYATRQGGYTRIVKDSFRAGDNAPMSIIQFV